MPPPSANSIERPILSFSRRLFEYPITACPAKLAHALQQKLGKPRLLHFECYLQVTGAEIPKDWATSTKWHQIVADFLGALYCPIFSDYSLMRAAVHQGAFIKATLSLNAGKPSILDNVKLSVVEQSSSILKIANKFPTELNSEAVAYWSGWRVTNVAGKPYWLPLAPIFRSLGESWTCKLHETIADSFAGSRNERIPALLEFAKYVEKSDTSAENLRDPFLITNFWRNFWDFYRSARGLNAKNRVLQSDWRNHWRRFAHEIFPSAGLMAKAPLRFPGPSRAPDETEASNDYSGPDSEFGMLLVDVPAYASDTQALELLLEAIPTSLSHVRKWSEAECADLYGRYRRRRALSRSGVARLLSTTGKGNGGRWQTSRANLGYLANAAATLEKYGYATTSDMQLALLYPVPLLQTAQELGLPTAGALLPFAAQLILEHPEITPSFLETFELYNKRGKVTGLQRVDGATHLVGKKYRKGKEGEQSIKLTHRTKRIVWKIIAITSEVRTYLRQAGNDDWRALFIATGKGFGQPRRIKRFATDSSGAHRLPVLKGQFQAHCALTADCAHALVQRFSLRTLRATVGVSVFLEKHSEQAMAEALGHARFDPTLLARYLPEPLLAFFRLRWVEAFQTNVLIVVTEGTGYELAATGLANREEMERFLESNALPRLRKILSSPAPCQPEREAASRTLFFNANDSTLAFIVAAANQEREREEQELPPTYWGQFSKHMCGVVDSRNGLDPDVDACMARARERAPQPVAA